MSKDKKNTHLFLDEAGDTTFFGKGKIDILGTRGVSRCFGIGMMRFSESLDSVRKKIRALEQEIARDNLLNRIKSVRKKISKMGFYFHAKDDHAEVRYLFFKLLGTLDCSFEMIVSRKIPRIFVNKHHEKESEFYADTLSHLIKDKLMEDGKIVLNIAERAKSTKNAILDLTLQKAVKRYLRKYDAEKVSSTVVFNVQTPRTEPLLTITDYCCWAVQRVFERGETRFYDYLQDQGKISYIMLIWLTPVFVYLEERQVF